MENKYCKTIYYKEIIKSTQVLGPGSRYAIWVGGCCFHCEGCVAESYNKGVLKESDVEELLSDIVSVKGISGVTISGGEPMLQAKRLYELTIGIRERSDLNIIIYSGFRLEELKTPEFYHKFIDEENARFVSPLLSITDILIDGRFVQELNDGRRMVGSSNQKIHNLSGRISNETIEECYERWTRQIEIRVHDNRTVMVGIPDKKQYDLWQKLKKEALL